MEKCENCGKVIGKLESPQIWKDSVVCVTCRKLLEGQDAERRTTAQQFVANERLAKIKRRNRYISLVFSAAIIGVIFFISTRHIPDGETTFYALITIVPIVAYMAWLPIMIVQEKGRKDKTAAIAALSIVGMLFSFGLLWLIAVVWAFGLKKEIET